MALIEALAVRAPVKGSEGLHKIGSATVLARSMDSSEFHNVAMPRLARMHKPGDEQKEEKASYIEHACCFRSNFNHGSSSKKGLIDSYVPEKRRATTP